jgi:hypothetical protein
MVQGLFQLCLGRSAEPDEVTLALEMLSRHTQQHRLSGRVPAERLALVDLCRAVLNLNEFAYID